MKILYYIRDDYLKSTAGDTILLLKMKEYLMRKDVEIVVSTSAYEDLQQYDFIHLFNTIRSMETYQFLKNCIRYKKKTILTPIYWNYIKYLPQELKNIEAVEYWRQSHRQRREIFKNVDFILPAAEIEMDKIKEDFHIEKPYYVIPNGVDIKFSRKSKANSIIGIKDYTLIVGRVCHHKNQLSIARATKKLGIPMVMVGPINDKDYYEKCMKENPKILYIPTIQHDDLTTVYNQAKVHSLVSWYEIPGLANLEAGLAGCHILTTDEGSTTEYLKDYVSYTKSQNQEIIIEYIEKLMNMDKNKSLKQHIFKNFLWERVSDKLLKIYRYIYKQ